MYRQRTFHMAHFQFRKQMGRVLTSLFVSFLLGQHLVEQGHRAFAQHSACLEHDGEFLHDEPTLQLPAKLPTAHGSQLDRTYDDGISIASPHHHCSLVTSHISNAYMPPFRPSEM